jgi:serine/threonine-protein kinase
VATSAPARRGAPVADDETLETRPRGRAAGTLPRMPIPRQPSGPRGLPPPPDEQENGRRNGPIVAVVVSAVVLLLGVSCFLVFTLGGGLGGLLGASPTPTAAPVVVTIPNFVGHTLTDAQALAAQDNLHLTTTYQTNNDVPKDQVISQQPIAGHYTGISTRVALTLSSGPGNVSVPDVTGKYESVACTQLENSPYYFICSNQGTMASNLPAGEVVKTDPVAGTLEPAHSIIKYWVSPGPPTPTAAPSPTATTAAPTATPTPTPTKTPTPPPSPLTITPSTATVGCSAVGSTSLSVSVPGAQSVTWTASSSNTHFTPSPAGPTTTAPGTPTSVTVNWTVDSTLHPGDAITITFTPTSPTGTPATATLTCG